MKYNRLFFILPCFLFWAACSGENLTNTDDEIEGTGNQDEIVLDTVEFRGLVYLDSPSIEGHLGGSERIVRQKMEKLFNDVTLYWNNCGKGRLNFYYRYVLGDIIPYDCGSNDPDLNKMVYNDPMDFSKYDFVVLFDALQDKTDDRGSGGAHGGGSDSRSVITVIAEKNKPKDIFDETTRNTLTHELGHYRGVTDVYQYIIEAEDNPVSYEKFDTYKCIMNWAAAGEWCDYAINCMNLAGDAKRIGIEFPDFFNSLYPQSMEFDITVGGKPERGVMIELYPSRAGASDHPRDIYPVALVSGKTNSDGKWILTDFKNYIVPNKDKHPEINIPPSLSYGRCFGFLAKVSYGTNVIYKWMSEIDIQMVTFEGKDSYVVNIDF